jgi:hypothetical protein
LTPGENKVHFYLPGASPFALMSGTAAWTGSSSSSSSSSSVMPGFLTMRKIRNHGGKWNLNIYKPLTHSETSISYKFLERTTPFRHHFIDPIVINALKHVTKQPNLASITNENNRIETKA